MMSSEKAETCLKLPINETLRVECVFDNVRWNSMAQFKGFPNVRRRIYIELVFSFISQSFSKLLARIRPKIKGCILFRLRCDFVSRL